MSGPGDFWARRKSAVQAEARAEEMRHAHQEAARQAEAAETLSDEEVLEALQLPDPDTLQPGDDFAAFLKAAVPERIRRRALRRLWTSNPVLANLDTLVEYGEDYTDAATVVENIQSAYQVGKGMLKHVEEMAAQAEEADAPQEGPAGSDGAAPADTATSLAETGDADEDAENVAAQDRAPEVHEVAAEAEAGAHVRRRMRFRFDDQAGNGPIQGEINA